jgi:RNA polymerase sigma-70 factor (ECF subfamily)
LNRPTPTPIEQPGASAFDAGTDADQKSGGVAPFVEVPFAPELTTSQRPEFPEIFRAYAPFLWRTLLGLGVPERDVDDLCQEVMMVVHRRLDDFDGRACRSWLYAICVRVASSYRKSARFRREVIMDAPESANPAASSGALLDPQRRLLDVLAELEEDKRTAFVLYEVEGLSLKEIAEATGRPLQTVYSRLQAARSAVREAFQESSSVTRGGRSVRT